VDEVRGADGDSDSTTFHVRRAQALEHASVAWLIARFSPLLLVQASYRLRGTLRRLYDPEDLVDEVWLVVLPRLGDLEERGGRLGPVLLRYLGTTLLNKANQMIQRALRQPPVAGALADSSTDSPALAGLPATYSDASSAAARDEAMLALRTALAELEEPEREILVLRGIEQVPLDAAAKLLGLTPGAVTRRYQKALERLRLRLPGSIFDELPDR
jgi:RNA polymerase sigma factor (sigma-70 family)